MIQRLICAENHMTMALDLLTAADVPADICGHLDLALSRLQRRRRELLVEAVATAKLAKG